MMIEALETLKSIPHWIFYKSETKPGDDKPAKMPKNPHSGRNAKSTDKTTWGTFYEAVKGNKRYSGSGLGWVFVENSGIVGIDLDHCIDETGLVAPWAAEIFTALNSYTEISPSGQGLHIFVYGKIPKALGPTPDSQIEMYAHSRYFTMTGDMLPGSFEKIAERQTAIDNLWQTESKRRREAKQKSREVLNTNAVVHPPTTDKLKKYTEKAYLDEIATLSMATSGCRNDTLNRCAFNLGQFVGAGLLGQTEIETTLLSIAVQLGLSDSEASKTIRSGLNGGLNNPRTTWPNDDETTPSVPPKKENPLPNLPQNDEIYHQNITPHLDYVKNRWGLTEESVKSFRLGYCDECPTSPYSASFTSPYYDSGRLLDIRHQLLSPNGQGDFRPEVEGYPPHLFNLDNQDDDWAILVEREFQTMLLHQNYLPVIGLPQTFKAVWVADLAAKGIKKVYVALNPGQGGGAARKVALLLKQGGIDARISTLPFSPRDMLVKYGCSLGDFTRFIEQGWGV